MKKAISMLCSLTVFMTLFAGMIVPAVSAEVGGNAATIGIENDDSQSSNTDFSEYGVLTVTTTKQTGETAAVENPTTTKAPPTSYYVTIDDFECIINNNEVTVTGYTGTATDLVIPSMLGGYLVTSIGECAFEWDDSLETVVIPDSVTNIGASAFASCNSLKKINIPVGVTSIEACTFYYCYSLSEIHMPSGITSIGERAFESCGLTNITLPESVTSIGDSAFSGCTALKSVTIPRGVTSIGNSVFYSCRSLVSITLHNDIASIGDYAFSFCDSLPNIIIPDSVISIGECAFLGCSFTTISIPEKVARIGNSAFENCLFLTSIEVDENNLSYTDIDGVLFTKDKKTIVWYPTGKPDNTYEIPDGVTTIGRAAFIFCSLTHITLPDGVTVIEDWAFSFNYGFDGSRYFLSLTIPSSVTTIGEYVFYESNSLEDVFYGGNKKQWAVITIGEYNDNLNSARLHYNTTVDHWELAESYSDPTCTEDGWSSFTCPCGYETERSILATGHTPASSQVIAPTCTTEGYTVYTCATCGDTYYEDYTTAGHTFENNVCNGCNLHVSECLASEHKYASNCDNTWTVYQEGAKSITLTFSPDTETDDGFDFIYIYDGEDNEVGCYTGTELASQTVTVAGDTAKIRLVSDDSMNYYGFAVTDVSVAYADTKIGDVNGDGGITLNDAAALFYYLNGASTLDEDALTAADMNGDGEVNLYDAVRLFYIVNGLIESE